MHDPTRQTTAFKRCSYLGVLLAGALAVGFAVNGCGGGSAKNGTSNSPAATVGAIAGTTSTTGASKAESLPKATLRVSFPTAGGSDTILSRYTCDGANVSLPVTWSGIPAHTAELALLVARQKSTSQGTFFDWAVAGLSPTSRGIPAGAVPAGAVVGRNGFGHNSYSICPPKGWGEELYIVRVLALPHSLPAKPGFDPEAFFSEAERSTKVVGIAGGVYTRR